MKKRFLATFLVLCLALGLLPGTAWAKKSETDIPYPVIGGNIYFNPDTGEITGCDESVTSAEIPQSISGVAVTSIGMQAFYMNKNLISVTIPKGVTTIEGGAFYFCENLATVNLPDGLKAILSTAFNSCKSLSQITFPRSLTKLQGFENCTSLTSVVIPEGITTIPSRTFYNCKSLTSVYIPVSVTKVGLFAFDESRKLKDVYYGGSADQWEKIVMTGTGAQVHPLRSTSKNIHYNSVNPNEPTYTLTYDLNGGEVLLGKLPEAQTYKSGELVRIPGTVECLLTREGYRFAGWSDGDETHHPGGAGKFFTMPDHDVVLKAIWELDPDISLSYDLNGGTGDVPEDMCILPGTEINLTAVVPVCNGYTFDGWSDGTTIYQPGAKFIMPYHDVTLIAQWAKIGTLFLSYDLDGGTGDLPVPTPYEAGTTVTVSSIIPTHPDKSTFMGWFVYGPSDLGKIYEPGKQFTMPKDNVILSAVWRPGPPVLGYNLLGGTGNLPKNTNVEAGSHITISKEVPVLDGYYFTGWSDGKKIYQPGDEYVMPNMDTAFVAQWKEFSLKYDLNGAPGESPKIGYYNAGETVTLAPAPVRETYIFKGWSDGTQTYESGSTFTIPKHDVVLTAQWELDRRVSFIEELTGATLEGVDIATKRDIQDKIYNLFFKAQFRPNRNLVNRDISFGRYNDDVDQLVTIQTGFPLNSGISRNCIYDGGLGVEVPFKDPDNELTNAMGCIAYGYFVSSYVYGNIGRSTSYRATTAAELKNLISSYADPGEQIRVDHRHSVVFLGVTPDNKGYYTVEFLNDYDGIWVSKHTYRDLFDSFSNTPIFLYDTNKGRLPTSYSNVSGELQCPVETTITFGSETLDSSTLNNGESCTSSFGSMVRTEDKISFSLEYRNDYDFKIWGTGTGEMTLTLQYNMGNTSTTRKFVAVPITASTKISTSPFDSSGDFSLYVSYGEGKTSNWVAGINGTAYAPESTPKPSDTPDTNYISIPKTDNGEIISSTRYAAQGERVTLSAHPAAGYELESVTVTDVRGRTVTVREVSDNRYTFTMPATRVEVAATFIKTEADTTPKDDELFTGLGTPGISGIVLNPAPLPFTDVQPQHWFYDNVDYVWKHYLMSGVSDTQFAPQLTTSRAMIWTILARMNNVRTDVNPGATWYERGMLWAMEQGVTDGTNPMGDITREQLAAMLWRNAGRPAPGAAADLTQFSDSNAVSGYAQTAVRWAVSVGILNGSNGEIDPQGTATRAQVAAMAARYGDRFA